MLVPRAPRCLFSTCLSLATTSLVKSETVVRSRNCVQSKIFTRTFLRGEARQSEGADAYHEGVADHFQRFISSNVITVRRYGCIGAVDKRGIVFFVIRSFARVLRGEAREECRHQRVPEGADAHHEGANDHFRRSISVDTLILRQDERGGAANEGTMVPFAMRCRTRESKRENT